jgi:hypothetical protein
MSLLLTAGSFAFAQKQDIEKKFDSKAAIEEFTYLASDELMDFTKISPFGFPPLQNQVL